MKNVIITGATSFIGLHLINRLLEGNYQIFAVIRPNTQKINALPKDERVKIIEADMSEYRNLNTMINAHCDIYFSLAWNGTRGADRDDLNMQEKNYVYSIEALKSVLLMGCKTVISAGSQAEYGLYNCKISEKTTTRPVTQYGIFKLKFFNDAYRLCKEMKVSFKEPRFFSLYGANDYEGTMIISMVKNMLQNKECRLTECTQMWDFLYISDAIDGLVTLIEKSCDEGAYNFGSGIAKPLKAFIEEMYKITNSQSKLLFGSIPYPSTGMVSIEPDVTKLMEETGWKPKVTFAEGIKKIISSI